MAAQIVMEIALPRPVLQASLSEGGPHETFEFLFMAAAFCIGLVTLKIIDWEKQKWLGVWVLLATICSFYVAGEEISWGQQLLHWTTPEFWDSINNQHETNLHNTSSWLDQKPRLLLQIGVLVGGIFMPIARKFKPSALPAKFAIIYPPNALFFTALMALVVNMTDRVDGALKNITFFERASEVEELYLFYFVMLYLIILKRRILQDKR
jgi:hypothetical protein